VGGQRAGVQSHVAGAGRVGADVERAAEERVVRVVAVVVVDGGAVDFEDPVGAGGAADGCGEIGPGGPALVARAVRARAVEHELSRLHRQVGTLVVVFVGEDQGPVRLRKTPSKVVVTPVPMFQNDHLSLLEAFSKVPVPVSPVAVKSLTTPT